MGTSQDFEVAVEEGATIVRIGTIIVGGGAVRSVRVAGNRPAPRETSSHAAPRLLAQHARVLRPGRGARRVRLRRGRAEPEAVLEDRYRERPNVRRLQGRRRRDEFDDIFAEEARGARGARASRWRCARCPAAVPRRRAAAGRATSSACTW